MTMASERVRAKALWNGERYSVESGGSVYVIKTYKQPGGSSLTSRLERRKTTLSRGFLGVGRHWKSWQELDTPIEEQDLEQEVTKVQ